METANIDALATHLGSYLSADLIQQVRDAYVYAEQAHAGQQRYSGESYITHPLAVAALLADMRMDHHSLMAALLHDVIEDTDVSKTTLSERFGDTVAELVDGVSKLTHMAHQSRAEAQAQNFQKMVLAMAKDIRVILIKLADRLHNMRTLGALPQEKRRRIARETLDIFAPIAQRLGMHAVRIELENLGFSALYPMRAQRIAVAVKKASGNRWEIVEQIQQSLEVSLVKEGHTVSVTGREKHLYSIYQKMRAKGKSFADIMDIYAFRIIVDNVDCCYRVLGCVHSLYKPVPGQFKDYIAIPKSNGYQSLHTVLFGLHGVPIEIQIRTQEMDEMANQGIAAHWLYKVHGKTQETSNHTRARQWLQGLLEMQQWAGNSLEFIENVKVDLFPEEVYVFSPKGSIIELPRASTAVDFAYAIHTDVGHACIAVRINRRLAPLSESLQSGQTVEIITARDASPNPTWLNFIVTGKARSAIRHFLKQQRQTEAIVLGKRLLDKALNSLASDLSVISEQQKAGLLSDTGHHSLDHLLEEIGMGDRTPLLTAHQLLTEVANQANVQGNTVSTTIKPLLISGTEGFHVNFAHCCYPIPGDAIVGFISAERGIVVHTKNCHNSLEFQDKPERAVALNWSPDVVGEFSVELGIELEKSRGIIALLANRINALDTYIKKISIEDESPQISMVNVLVGVQSRLHLARIMKRIRSIKDVLKVVRVKH